jgi:glycosyltransferase domain-containing protein
MPKVDLFIPTYNRPDFLKRLLTFYQSYGVKYRIIVADSSTDANKRINKKTVASFKKLNLVYSDRYLPSQISHDKFGRMLKLAKSKYTVFCADDDFLIPSGIDEAVKFLEKNKDYASAHGTYIAFYVNEGIPFARKFLWRFIYPYRSITYDDPLKRLIYHLSNYYQVLWAVRRTEVLKKAYSEFLRSKTDPVLFGELAPDMLTLIYGKMKRLDTFYGARQAFSTAYGYWPTLQDAIKAGTFQKKYTILRRNFIKNLAVRYSEKALKEIDIAMNKYLKHSTQEHLIYQINLFLNRFPKSVGDFARKIHVVYLHSKRNSDRIGKIDDPGSKYFSDFQAVKKHVIGS